MLKVDLDKIIIQYSSVYKIIQSPCILTFDEFVKFLLYKDLEVYYKTLDLKNVFLKEVTDFLLAYEDEIPNDMQKYLLPVLLEIFHTNIETLKGEHLLKVPIKEWKNFKYLIINKTEKIGNILSTITLYQEKGLL